jgi:hypothetical protein
MRWQALVCGLLTVAPLAAVGCQSARFVQTQASGGVVAIPSNTNSWPNYHRDHALELIAKKCPNGYVIDREEEVVVGQRTQVDTQRDTQRDPSVTVGGLTGSSSNNNKGGKSSSDGIAAVTFNGDTRTSTQQTIHASDITEWRIYYHAK